VLRAKKKKDLYREQDKKIGNDMKKLTIYGQPCGFTGYNRGTLVGGKEYSVFF